MSDVYDENDMKSQSIRSTCETHQHNFKKLRKKAAMTGLRKEKIAHEAD